MQAGEDFLLQGIPLGVQVTEGGTEEDAERASSRAGRTLRLAFDDCLTLHLIPIIVHANVIPLTFCHIGTVSPNPVIGITTLLARSDICPWTRIPIGKHLRRPRLAIVGSTMHPLIVFLEIRAKFLDAHTCPDSLH